MLLAVIGVHPVGMAWIEGTGRTDLFLSVGFAVGALLFLPVLLVAWRAARSAPDDVALTDVVTIAMLARQPQVDRYCEGLVPAVVATD